MIVALNWSLSPINRRRANSKTIPRRRLVVFSVRTSSRIWSRSIGRLQLDHLISAVMVEEVVVPAAVEAGEEGAEPPADHALEAEGPPTVARTKWPNWLPTSSKHSPSHDAN